MTQVAETEVRFQRRDTHLPIRKFTIFMMFVSVLGLVFAVPEIVHGYWIHDDQLVILAWLTLALSATAVVSIVLIRTGHPTAGVYAWSFASCLPMSLIPLVAVGFVPSMLVLAAVNILVVALFVSPRRTVFVIPCVIVCTAISSYLEYRIAWQRLQVTGLFVFVPLLVNVIGVLVVVALVRVFGDVLLRALEITEDYVQQLETATKEELKYIATHDSLTGLPNRLLLNDRFQLARARARRSNQFFGVLIIDLDNFKTVNDTMGHSAGDELLKRVAVRFQQSVRECDTVSRLGGDEFVVLLEDLSAGGDSRIVAERISRMLAPPIDIGHREIHVTASIGIGVFPSDGEDIEALLKNADVALYEAKEQGRNTYRFFSKELGANAVEKMETIAGLRTALERGEMALYYQPMIDLTSGKLSGMEALLRWRRAGGEIVSPMKFIPAAEESGLIIPIGTWVLAEACRQVMEWKKAGFDAAPIAVNLSVRQVRHAALVETIVGVLEETGADPAMIELEITESTAMQDIENTTEKLRKLRDLGFKIVIDDFGSGYSSLLRLSTLPISALKIDRFFIQNIGDDPNIAAIVMAVVSMAHHMNLQVIAEGIETANQLDYLKSLQWNQQDGKALLCDRGQGFFFARPIPAEQVQSTISKLLDTTGS